MTLSARATKPRKAIDNPKPDVPHMARLISITDLGHQPPFTYNGKEIESAWKYEFGYELVESKMEDGRPHCVWEEVEVNDYEPPKGSGGFTCKMMARVRALDLENESNDGKDLVKLLNKPCMVTPTENDKGYTKLKGQSAVAGVPFGMAISEAQNPIFSFDMTSPDMDLWETFSDFKKEKMQSALNFPETELAKQLAEDDRF